MHKHLFITAESAAEAIEFANLCIVDKAKQDGRTKGFNDCTEYWKNEILKIAIMDLSDSEKWADLKKLFRV